MTKFLQATLILLLLVVLPCSAWAQMIKRGNHSCSDFAEGERMYRQDPDDLDKHSMYASCLVIKGEDNKGLPELYTLADHHDSIPASYFLAAYLGSDGQLDGYLTQTKIEEALHYFFRTLALIDLFPNYPGEEYDLYELTFQAELRSSYYIPLLYAEKYKIGIMNDSCKRAIAHGYKEECPTHHGYDSTTMDSLKKAIQYARECASLPKKRFFQPDYYQGVIKSCVLIEEVHSKLIPLEEKRQKLLLRSDCQDVINCDDYNDHFDEIKTRRQQYVKELNRSFATDDDS